MISHHDNKQQFRSNNFGMLRFKWNQDLSGTKKYKFTVLTCQVILVNLVDLITSLSMLEFCGLPTATLEANTIAKNIANSTKGNLIKFSGDTKAGTENQNDSSILSGGSTLSLTSNTIVENKAYTTFLYDKLGAKYLDFNVLAYNQGDYSCRYLLGDI